MSATQFWAKFVCLQTDEGLVAPVPQAMWHSADGLTLHPCPWPLEASWGSWGAEVHWEPPQSLRMGPSWGPAAEQAAWWWARRSR